MIVYNINYQAGVSLADKNPATNAALINEQDLTFFGRDLQDIKVAKLNPVKSLRSE